MLRIGAAFGAEFNRWHLILVALFLAILFFDLPLDGQAVAIPARHIRHILALQALGADHHIFEDMIERMADMHVAIRVRRAIMINELLTTTALFAQTLIESHFLPAGKNKRLFLRQSSFHREIGLRQEDGVAIINHFFGRGVRHSRRALGQDARQLHPRHQPIRNIIGLTDGCAPCHNPMPFAP